MDRKNRALNMIRDLSNSDFGTPGIQFNADGSIVPAPRKLPIVQQN
jgi:hypothetical protein